MVRVLVAAAVLVLLAFWVLARAEGPTPVRDSATWCEVRTHPDTGKQYLACAWRYALPVLAAD